MADSAPDGNHNLSITALSSAGDRVVIPLVADPTTKRLLVDTTGGSSGSSATQVVVTAGTVTIAAGTVSVNPVTIAAGTVGVNVIGTVPVSFSGGTFAISSGTVATNLIQIAGAAISSAAAGVQKVGVADGSGNSITSTGAALDVNLKTSSIVLPVTGTIAVSGGTVNIGTFVNPILVSGGTVVVTTGTIVVNSGTIQAVGNIASGIADVGNPLKIGAVAQTQAPTAVTNGQRVNLIADKVGKLIAVGAIRDLKATQYTGIYNSTATTAVVTAGGAGVFNDVYGILVSNTASAVNKLVVSSGSPGVTQFVIEVPANDMRGWMVPVDSAWIQPSAATVWNATCLTAGSVEVSIMYVKNI